MEDAYNHALKDKFGRDLDDEFHELTLGSYKAKSFPPSNFNLDRDIEIPAVFQHYMDKWAAAKRAKNVG